MVQVHDSTATQAYDEFNDTIHQFISYDANLEHCHEVEGESGESREASEASLREAAAENVKLVEAVFVDFNQSLPRWAGYVEGYRSDVSKRKRAKLGQIAELLREAHDEHAEEFFHMKGIWVQMEGVHCAGAEEEKQATVNAGSGAWTKEAAALRLLEVLFGVRETIEYPLGPYV